MKGCEHIVLCNNSDGSQTIIWSFKREPGETIAHENCTQFTIFYSFADFRDNPIINLKQLQRSQEVDYLTMYDKALQIATVSMRAPKWYQSAAALHEHLCCGRQNADQFAVLKNTADENDWCKTVEQIIVESMGEYTQEYIKMRIAMFKFMLEHRLCADDFRQPITRTLRYLEGL